MTDAYRYDLKDRIYKRCYVFKSIKKFPNCEYDKLLLILLNEGITEDSVQYGRYNITDIEKFRKYMRWEIEKLKWRRDAPYAEEVLSKYLEEVVKPDTSPF